MFLCRGKYFFAVIAGQKITSVFAMLSSQRRNFLTIVPVVCCRLRGDGHVQFWGRIDNAIEIEVSLEDVTLPGSRLCYFEITANFRDPLLDWRHSDGGGQAVVS